MEPPAFQPNSCQNDRKPAGRQECTHPDTCPWPHTSARSGEDDASRRHPRKNVDSRDWLLMLVEHLDERALHRQVTGCLRASSIPAQERGAPGGTTGIRAYTQRAPPEAAYRHGVRCGTTTATLRSRRRLVIAAGYSYRPRFLCFLPALPVIWMVTVSVDSSPVSSLAT